MLANIMYSYHNVMIEKQYDIISSEFDDTRHKVWGSVKSFLSQTCTQQYRRLLEVGIGNGKNTLFASQQNYECIGIDISEKLLTICKNKGLSVFKRDIMCLHKDVFGLFDDIICIAVIHHLENIEEQKKGISNMIECLRSGGRLLISVWSYEIYQPDGKQINDYRDFNLGANLVKWKAKTTNNEVNRYYFIHNHKSFEQLFLDLSGKFDFQYKITWEKQNWFCELTMN